jgi:hypothetical protein
MKKILLILAMLFVIPAFADVMPYYVNAIPKDAIGVYQTGESLTIFSEPDSKSRIIRTFDFSYNPETMPEGIFGILLNEKKLGFIYVSDIGDDGWVEIIYDRKNGTKGWVMTEDKFQFMPWINFYNMYGRKYGLRILKDAPDEVNFLHAKSEALSQGVAKMNYVKSIKLTKISGNWALVSAIDLDKIQKMGYMRWRSDNGIIYAVPNVK